MSISVTPAPLTFLLTAEFQPTLTYGRAVKALFPHEYQWQSTRQNCPAGRAAALSMQEEATRWPGSTYLSQGCICTFPLFPTEGRWGQEVGGTLEKAGKSCDE